MNDKSLEVTSIVQALSAGSQIANSAFWKKATLSTNYAVVFIVGGLEALKSAGLVSIDISAEDINTIFAGGAALLSVFNAVMTVLTSAKVSLNPLK